MRLATIIVDSRPRVVVAGSNAELYPIDLLLASDASYPSAPASILELIEKPMREQERIKSALARALQSHRVSAVTPEAWLPPIPRPSKVVGVALNNASLARFAYRYFAQPAFFLKSPSSLIGHHQPIVIRESYGLTHPEPELAVIIGQRASRISEDAALDHVFGYSIINDITSVGLKDEDSIHFRIPLPARSSSWRKRRNFMDSDIYLTYHGRSKSTDTFGPMGPWLVTHDDVPNPNDLTVRSWIGDELIAEDSTANLHFSVPKVLAHLSAHMTLEPGDVVHMGTAVKSRLPTLRNHDMRKKRDACAIEIQGLGRLINPILVTT